MSDPFIRCTLPCTFCGAAIAQLHTAGYSLPRLKLTVMARENGAVHTEAGDWFCNPKCRMNHRLEHGVHHIDVPEVGR